MNATAPHIELDDQLAPASLPDEPAVEAWFRALCSRGIGVHLERTWTFAEIVDPNSGSRMFRPEDAARLDALMGQAASVCDPCSVALRAVMPGAVADEGSMVRVSEQGSRFEITTIRNFLKRTLSDDAVADQVTELMFEHVVEGRLEPSVVATTLTAYIEEVLQTATDEDWQAVADEEIAAARELLAEDAA
ncbi:MAG: hypothetical protein AB7T48_04655 [Solirubrobacterales bacterium]